MQVANTVSMSTGMLLDKNNTNCSEMIEQGLTSHQTHYRSYRRRFLQVIRPNQQCQSTEGSQLVFQI